VFAHWDLVNMLARKQFRAEHLVIESADFVLGRLAENDWERVRKHAGKGAIRAYLSRVIQRLLHDFARQQFGRKQTPRWLAAQPGFWQKVHRLLCLERLPAREVIELVSMDVPGGRDDRAVREAIAVIRTKDQDCGQSHAESGDVSLEDAPEPAGNHGAAETAVEHAGLTEVLYGLLTDERAEPHPAVMALQAELQLGSEERLLLRMVFEDGMKVTEAGRLLGLSTHAVHGQMRRLLARIRTAVEGCGLADALKASLEGESP
jgi:RNA polymerase sigma factor (sigma-70 family)